MVENKVKRKDNSCPVIVNEKFIFIGPIKANNIFCIECYKERMKEINLYDYYFGYKSSSITAIEEDLVEYLKEKIINNRNEAFLYEINRFTLEIEMKSTFKRGDCINCSDLISEIIPKTIKSEFDPNNLRQVKFDKVIEQIDAHKKLIYGSKSSIINSISRSGDSYGTPMVQTEVLYKDVSMLSYGRTSEFGQSKYISILESLERYATAFPYKKKQVQFVEGESCLVDITLSEVINQSNYLNSNNYNKNIPLNYEEVISLHNNKNVLIPEQLIYFNSHSVSGEERYIYESSNGSAIGSTMAEASLHAMLELFERDAFLATWYGRIPPVRINTSNINSKKVQLNIDSLKRKNIIVHIFDISLEMQIPIIWVLLEKINPKFNEMAFYTAAAAAFTLDEAIERALIEATTAITVFTNVFDKDDYLKRKAYLLKDPSKVSKLEDHLLLYSKQEMKSKFTFALETSEVKTMEEIENNYVKFEGDFNNIVDYMEKIILTISDKAYKAVTPNLNLLLIGLTNVKYIVPGMLTMTFGHQNRRVVTERIEKAIKLKKKGEYDLEWIKNNPHPFP